MAKTITILGSTGSIGVSALRVLRSLGDEFRVRGLVCRENLELLEKQVEEFRPDFVAVESTSENLRDDYNKLSKKFPGIEFINGEEGVIEVAGKPVDILLSAIVGAAGLKPTLEAIKVSKRIALANKETLVMAGDLFISEIQKHNVELIPVDSEHNAIFLLKRKMSDSEIENIILTASGGSLKDVPFEELHKVTPEMALAHPTWDMGNKITIDSATLMNKGLEVIEAHYLFDADYDNIEIIIHPQSVVHSMIEAVDGAIYALMGVTDMALPILTSLKYPDMAGNNFGRLKLADIGSLNFRKCDKKKHYALELCYDAGRSGGTMPAVLNAANEVAVNAFLNKQIKFTDIVKVIEKVMNKHSKIDNPDLEIIFSADKEAREITESLIRGD
ncbi:1-deoxy-D-xylulose-5-phosphate reductoisomerase [Spirochaetota bacterium]